jgi:hypothetical protein
MADETRSLDEAIKSQTEINKKAEKPGFLTSEFWASAVGAPLTAGLVALKLLDAGSPIAAAIVGVVGIAGPIGYAFMRGGLKKALAAAIPLLQEALKKKDSEKGSE